jgi:hypothetical protein
MNFKPSKQMQASSLRESDGGYIRERTFETLTRSSRQTLGPPRSFEKSGAVLRRKPQQPRFMLLVALSADVAAEPGRITGDSYIGGLPFRVEGSPLSSIAANGS